jgi:hypothetical protein
MSEPGLDLTMHFFVIQLYHRASDPVSINLFIRNTARDIYKFCFTTVERRNPARASKRSTTILLEPIPADVWVNLCFDLAFIVARYWPDAQFESLNGVEIAPPCLIRWIFAVASPLRPEAAGQDLPQVTRLTGGVESATVLVGDQPVPVVSRASRIPVRSPKVKTPLSPGHAPRRSASHRPTRAEEEDDARGGIQPDAGLPDDEEEELDLVFIETLGCYYCPNNQKYYMIDG